jgi:hypothetical protein
MLRACLFTVVPLTLFAGCAAAPTVCVPAVAPILLSAPPAATLAPAGPAAAVSPTEPAPAVAVAPPVSPTAAAVSSDLALSQAIVGSWIVPRESSDFRRVFAREEYRADGSYSLYYFDSAACAKVTSQVDAVWHIERGLLITTVTHLSTGQFGKVGDQSIDQIITMSSQTMTLQATSDAAMSWSFRHPVFSRRKSTGCFDS